MCVNGIQLGLTSIIKRFFGFITPASHARVVLATYIGHVRAAAATASAHVTDVIFKKNLIRALVPSRFAVPTHCSNFSRKKISRGNFSKCSENFNRRIVAETLFTERKHRISRIARLCGGWGVGGSNYRRFFLRYRDSRARINATRSS